MLQTLIAERTVEVKRPLIHRISSRLFGRPPSATVMLPMIAEALVDGPTVGLEDGPTLRIDVENGHARVVLDLGAAPARWPTTVSRVTLREKGTHGRMFPPRFHIGRIGIDKPSPVEAPCVIDPWVTADTWSPDSVDFAETVQRMGGHAEVAGLGHHLETAMAPAPRRDRMGDFVESAGLMVGAVSDVLDKIPVTLHRSGPAEESHPLEALMLDRPAAWDVLADPMAPAGTVIHARSEPGAIIARLNVMSREAAAEARRLEEARDGADKANRRAAYDRRALEWRHREDALHAAAQAVRAVRGNLAAGGLVKPGRAYLVGERGPEHVEPVAGGRTD